MRTNARSKAGWTIAGLLALGIFLGAPRARAGDDFERGFKNELGRIAAREVVHVGRHLVSDVVWGYGQYRYRPRYPARPVGWHYGSRRRAYPRGHFQRPRVVREYHYYEEPCPEHRDTHSHRR